MREPFVASKPRITIFPFSQIPSFERRQKKMAPLHGTSTAPAVPAVLGEATKFEGVRGVNQAPGHGGVVGINEDKTVNAGPGVFGQSDQGEGVRGSSKADWHGGVVGTNDGTGTNAGPGVYGESKVGEGVRGVGHSEAHAAVVGTNDSASGGAGVFGSSQGAEGVRGESNAGFWTGAVSGFAMNSNGAAAGVLGQANGTGPGVFGKGRPGVMGFHGDPRLQETTVANDADRAGVFGASDNGVGVLGYSADGNTPAIYAFGGFRAIALGKPLAGLFDGNVQVNGDIFLPGADCAEHFDVAGQQPIEPGSVVVLDQDGLLAESREAYDRKVAGVVSGAGLFRPAIVLDKQSTSRERQPIALMGKVYCKVDAEYSPVRIGDMLTTSLTPGHAMKADDPIKAFGAVIGKALGNLPSGRGLLPILVALQ
jgi:hypothetical protein